MAADTDRIYTAALVIIGDEVLSGRTQDANLAYLAKWLNVQGIRLAHARIVPDEMAAIGEAINDLRHRYDYLFTTGGIGPTHDDITVEAIAAALRVPVVLHPRAEAMLRSYYGDRITDARLRMARVPEGADLIDNPVSGAPGIRIGNIFILAGIPKIAQGMLAGLEGKLDGGRPVLSRTVGAYVGESMVAELLQTTEREHAGTQIGSYPFWRDGRVGANFVVRATDPHSLAACVDALIAGLRKLGVEPTDGEI